MRVRVQMLFVLGPGQARREQVRLGEEEGDRNAEGDEDGDEASAAARLAARARRELGVFFHSRGQLGLASRGELGERKRERGRLSRWLDLLSRAHARKALALQGVLQRTIDNCFVHSTASRTYAQAPSFRTRAI